MRTGSTVNSVAISLYGAVNVATLNIICYRNSMPKLPQPIRTKSQFNKHVSISNRQRTNASCSAINSGRSPQPRPTGNNAWPAGSVQSCRPTASLAADSCRPPQQQPVAYIARWRSGKPQTSQYPWAEGTVSRWRDAGYTSTC